MINIKRNIVTIAISILLLCTLSVPTSIGDEEIVGVFTPLAQGEPPILTAEIPTNGSTEIEMYPTLSITVNDPSGLNFNISWGTNVSGDWAESYQNLTCINGTYTQTAVWANTSATKYWWYVNATNTGGEYTNETYHFTTDEYHWGTWSDWWQFNFSSDAPTNLVATGHNKTQINLTWTNGAVGADATVIIRNESGWAGTPSLPTNGTEIYNSTGTNYEDDGLNNGTQYCYSAWSWNNTEGNYSLEHVSDCASTIGDIEMSNPYPGNNSVEITRPPVNYSVQIDGTNLDIYFYFYNLTPVVDVWTLHHHWSGQSTGRFEIVDLTSLSPGTQFIWGNTTYTWTVNITDGVTWINNSYTYTTTHLAHGANARYDVSNDNWVDGSDLLSDYAHRTGQTPYDGIYDVNNDDWIDGSDLLQIYANRS